METLVAAFLFPFQATTSPIMREIRDITTNASSADALQITTSLKVVLTFFAILSVSTVTLVYGFLIRRGIFMGTTCLLPRKSIEDNLANLLSYAWPNSSEISTQEYSAKNATSLGPGSLEEKEQDAIRLFYLGRMTTDNSALRVAKGVRQCAAIPAGESEITRSAVWLSSGSPTMKCTVQLLIWEWISLWLVILMLLSTLIYNGFFSAELSLDSFPRLVVTLIYCTSFLTHFYYVWNVSLTWLTRVAAGSAWSLLERANFAVGEVHKLYNRTPNRPIQFRNIYKASSEYIPRTFQAFLKHEVPDTTPANSPMDGSSDPDEETRNKLTAALKTMDAIQTTERDTARQAATQALDRVIANAMVLVSITLSTGFSAWTSVQATDNTPDNFASSQLGSLALLASLALGAAAMFASALQLSILEASFRAILSLKEVRINGQAVEHYKKRQPLHQRVSLIGGRLPRARLRFWDVLAVNKGVAIIGVVFLGPAFGLLPRAVDDERTSERSGFDICLQVRENRVVLTTRETDRHSKNEDGSNIEAINVCYMSKENCST